MKFTKGTLLRISKLALLLVVMGFVSCGGSSKKYYAELEKIENCSASPYSKDFAFVILNLKYGRELDGSYSETIYQELYDVLKETNALKASNYNKTVKAIENSDGSPYVQEIAIGVLSYRKNKSIDAAPFVEEIIEVLDECKILK